MLRLWPFNRATRTAAFTVHEPADAGGSKLERAERLVFVGDRFSWRAALFSPFYLALRGEWMALGVYAAAALFALAVLNLIGADASWYVWAVVLLNAVAGFEASELQRWSLGRNGWRELGTVSGASAEEAERRFFEDWLPTLPADTEAAAPPPHAAPGSPIHRDAVSRAESSLHKLSARFRGSFAPKT